MADTTNVRGTTTPAIAGYFRDEDKAHNAMEELRASGFSDEEIGVATPRPQGKLSRFWDQLNDRFGKREHEEEASDLEGSLRDSGIPEQEAGYFNSELNNGGVLVTLHAAEERARRALLILQQNGADVGNAAAEWHRSSQTPMQAGKSMRLLGEILRVHKERVARGEVRLRKEVVTETQNLEVPVTREELVIERTPGTGEEAAGAEIGSGEKEIRVPLTEERVHVEKKPVVNEEIRVGKREVEDTKRVSDQVRHEELRSETQGDVGKEEVETPEEKRRKAA